MTSAVYSITNNVTRKKYIGCSFDYKKRFKSHLCSLRRGNHINEDLQLDFNIYGESSFTFGIVYQNPSYDKVQSKERKLIESEFNLYNKFFNDKENTRYLKSTEAKKFKRANSSNLYNKIIESGFSIHSLAFKLNTKPSALFKKINNCDNFNLKQIKLMSEQLNITTNELLTILTLKEAQS